MMKLDVPLIRQPKDSLDCGIAGIAMLLSYHGIKTSYEELKKQLEVNKVGTYAPQLGTFLISKGFDVSIITLHPKLFTIHDKAMTKEALLERLRNVYSKALSDQDKKVLMHFVEFVKAGGKLVPKIPSREDVLAEIKSRRPLGALLTTNMLNAKEPKFNFHFNIITGIDDKYVYANDPMWDDRGGNKEYGVEEFFYALYASAYGDIDNASFMIVKRR